MNCKFFIFPFMDVVILVIMLRILLIKLNMLNLNIETSYFSCQYFDIRHSFDMSNTSGIFIFILVGIFFQSQKWLHLIYWIYMVWSGFRLFFFITVGLLFLSWSAILKNLRSFTEKHDSFVHYIFLIRQKIN